MPTQLNYCVLTLQPLRSSRRPPGATSEETLRSTAGSRTIAVPPVVTGRHAEWVYPRSMARKPSEPSPKSTGSKTSDSAETTDSTETTGPIAIVRLRKADGRALILYSDSAGGDRA